MSSSFWNIDASVLPYREYLVNEPQLSIGAFQEMVTVESVKFKQARKIFGVLLIATEKKPENMSDIKKICLKLLVLINYNGIILQKLR